MMRSLAYPATLMPDRKAGGFTVTFPDLPEAITQGEDRLDALEQAADCIEEAIAGRIRRGDEIPAPSKRKASQTVVPVPPLMAAKAALYLAMREAKMSNVKLAKQLGCDEKDVRRMLDPRHNSRITALQAALAVLGKKIVVAVEDAA
jgi:antitoxin HicB